MFWKDPLLIYLFSIWVWVLTSMTSSCFVPSFTYWNVNAMLPLIKIIECMLEYFIGPITLGLVPVEPECMLQMSTWAIQQITPEKRHRHRLLENLTVVVPRCWLTYAPGVSLGKGVMILCDGLYIKLYIRSKTQFKLMMDEVSWKLMSITLSPLKGITLYTMGNPINLWD